MNEINCNINNNVEVILTKTGADILNNYLDDFVKRLEGFSGAKFSSNKIYKEGDVYSTELWSLMNTFGSYMYVGTETLFKDNNITIKDI